MSFANRWQQTTKRFVTFGQLEYLIAVTTQSLLLAPAGDARGAGAEEGDNPDGEGALLRIWEQAGKSGKLIITLPKGHGFTKAQPCSLRGEESGSEVSIIDGGISVHLGAYQPVSFLLR